MAAIWEGKGDGLIPVWVGEPMQMASRTNAAWGVAGNIGLRQHKKYPRLCRGYFLCWQWSLRTIYKEHRNRSVTCQKRKYTLTVSNTVSKTAGKKGSRLSSKATAFLSICCSQQKRGNILINLFSIRFIENFMSSTGIKDQLDIMAGFHQTVVNFSNALSKIPYRILVARDH